MTPQDFLHLYAKASQAEALVKALTDDSLRTVSLGGLQASASAVLFAAIAPQIHREVMFVGQDADEAGYFYHDLTQLIGNDNVLFFPSSYKRAVKYGQRDAANEILRTEVLTRLSSYQGGDTAAPFLYIVTYPEALSELVVSQQHLDERRISIKRGQRVDIIDVEHKLREFGFSQQDYVYEPGQFAVRGSILDVYSYSCELPYRIDFFDDEVDSIRTFEVEDQLSKDLCQEIAIVPELAQIKNDKIPFPSLLAKNSLIVAKDFDYIRQTIGHIYEEGFSSQAVTDRMAGATEMEQQAIKDELKSENTLMPLSSLDEATQHLRIAELSHDANKKSQALLRFNISPQPLFHKNFDLLRQSIESYLIKGYHIYILADSQRQQERLRDIFNGMDESGESVTLQNGEWSQRPIEFTPVEKTIHEGFIDNTLKICCFTDHQIFDRFHKYSLKSDRARSGKMALTMKELQEMEPGDFIVHVDYGIGKFGGLLRVPTDKGFKEVIRIIYQNNDKVDVSIHSLYKISKYRSNETGQPPRLSVLGTGAWDRMKERAKKRIKDIARDLIKLYAKRRYEKGFAFSPDSFMQHELEASFFYEDTPDQLKATQDVKADMESAHPMDRLICGDVGFGKTEVAIRAAFKAACASRLSFTFTFDQKDASSFGRLGGRENRYSHRHPQTHRQGREVARPRTAYY